MSVVSIGVLVEGHGETRAVPVLLRRIVKEVAPETRLAIEVLRVGRQQVVKSGKLEAGLDRLAGRTGLDGRLLVLLDADDDCPALLGPVLLERARNARRDRTIRVVLAKAEYEAWFLAAAESIGGQCGLPERVQTPADPESVRDAKHWLAKQMGAGKGYDSARELVELTRTFDLKAARSAPSFDKMWRDVEALVR